MQYLNYRVTFTNYNVAKTIDTNCNSITFINQGTTVATIEDLIQLQPSTSLEIAGNLGELTTQTFQINFVGAGTNNLTVIRKSYTS